MSGAWTRDGLITSGAQEQDARRLQENGSDKPRDHDMMEPARMSIKKNKDKDKQRCTGSVSARHTVETAYSTVSGFLDISDLFWKQGKGVFLANENSAK